jgi:tetratricopeptide (TPR) repeat protein
MWTRLPAPGHFCPLGAAAIFLTLVSVLTEVQAGPRITVEYGHGHNQAMQLTLAGQTQLEKGELEAARHSLDSALQNDPSFFPARYVRARLFLRQRKYEEAIQDCNEALHQNSSFAEAALLRAAANAALGRYRESLKEIDHVISIRPRQDALARAYGDRAFLRLNCPDPSIRSERQAINDALIGSKLMQWQDEEIIDTLASAYAKTGDFESAVRYEERALKLKSLPPDVSKRLQEHLALFRQHRVSS